MIDKYSLEFSKLYSRLMRLELYMKKNAIYAVFNYYKKDSIKILSKFFNNKDRLKRYDSRKYGNKLRNIFDNNKLSVQEKFEQLINSLYLSDVLFLVLHCKEFFEQDITKAFYYKIPTKFAVLKSDSKHLISLRNDIAHYNIDNYEINKKKYWDVLLLFEIHMGHNTKGILELPYFGFRPTMKNILISIGKLRPDLLDINFRQLEEKEYYYNKHRVMLELYDEIALYNGYNISELPSPWSILREMYRVKSEL
jgi:hypothetical protein